MGWRKPRQRVKDGSKATEQIEKLIIAGPRRWKLFGPDPADRDSISLDEWNMFRVLLNRIDATW